MRKKQIPIEKLKLGMYVTDLELKPGMYVTELDRRWLGTSFLLRGFPINSKDHLDELKRLCQTVTIDVERDASGGARRGPDTAKEAVRGTKVYKETWAVEKELVVAKEVYFAFERSIETALESIRRGLRNGGRGESTCEGHSCNKPGVSMNVGHGFHRISLLVVNCQILS